MALEEEDCKIYCSQVLPKHRRWRDDVNFSREITSIRAKRAIDVEDDLIANNSREFTREVENDVTYRQCDVVNM